MRISDWSSDVCSSDLQKVLLAGGFQPADEIGLELGKRWLHALITMGSRRIHHRAQQRGRAFRLWRQAVMQAFRQQSGSDVGHLSPSPCWGEGWGEGLLPSIALLIIVATPSRFSITSALVNRST